MAAKHGQARSDKRSHPKSSPRCIKKSVTKASAMTGVWQAWLQHCLVTSRTWVHAALMLAYMFCGRISQILALRGEDFDWDRQQVHFRKFKKHPAVWKPILPVFMKKLKQLRDSGVSYRRSTACGARRVVTFVDTWQIPKSGLLFKSIRSDAKECHRTKDTISRAIARARSSFSVNGQPFHERQRIRSHSARHRMIQDLKLSMVGEEAGMFFAAIRSKDVYREYGALAEDQCRKILRTSKSLCSCVKKTLPPRGG